MTDAQPVLTAIDLDGLWSAQPDREHGLDAIAAALFDATDHRGKLLGGDGCHLLRAWPHQAYLLTQTPTLPARAEPFSALFTDISDAFRAFRLEGDATIDFLGDYLSADIRREPPTNHCLRCRFGHYAVLLWWQRRERVQLLVERSLAQSFEDDIERLMVRRYPEAS